MADLRQVGNQGRIEVICGCMFAGKTAALIERLRRLEDAGRCVLAFNHVLDQRYTGASLATHDGRRFPARVAEDAAVIEPQAGDANAEVVGIDECHFFGGRLTDVCRRLRARGVQVIVAGLDHDTWGQAIPPFPELNDIADDVTVKETPCVVCGQPARFSQRLTPVVGGNLVGGPGDFEPRCGGCFRPLTDLPPPVYERDG